MSNFASILVGLIALQHIGFLVLEMFLWDTPAGLRVFGHSVEKARASKALAANMGLYNGFLAAGLLWGLSRGGDGTETVVFFLLCILVAGIFGALTVSRKIFFVQGLPAAAALLLLVMR